MGTLRKLARLDRAERRLLYRAVLWVLGARVGLRLLPFAWLERVLGKVSARHRLPYRATPENVRWAVAAAARRLPGTACLAWSLACRGLLGQVGIASDLRFGVARTPEGRFLAHAWVECGGRTLSWGDEPAAYAPLGSVATRDA